MCTVSPVQIILQRRSGKDDVINIWPSEEEGLYDVRYEDKDSKAKYMFRDSWQNVRSYLTQIFQVLPLDQQPFEGVQFTLPAYPSIVVRTDDTDDASVMMPVWSMIDSVVNGWPATTQKPSWKA
jgi:hypothetical protein